MLYAVDIINKRNDILPGIKLGTIIYDTCLSPTRTADATKEFIKVILTPPSSNSPEFAAVIGTFKSGNSVIAANILRVFGIPQISYASSTVKLSNKDIYNYFFRTIPPDSFFAPALVDFLKRQGWSQVSIVYSTGTWAETGTQEVRNALKQNNICIANDLLVVRFPQEKDFDDIIERLVIDDKQPKVVILITIQRDSRGLLEAKKRNKGSRQLFFVGSPGWSNRGDITEHLEHIADGTISFGIQKKQIPGFEKYFQSLSVNNYSRNYKKWIGEYWQNTYQCKLQNFSIPTSYTAKCSGDEENRKHKNLAPVQLVINAVQATANALDRLQRHLCPGTVKMCKKMKPLNRTLLLEFLKNVTFQDAAFHFPVKFNANQEVGGNFALYNFYRKNGFYDFIQIGNWQGKLNANGLITGTLFFNKSKVRWGNGTKNKPQATCRQNCSLNQVNVYLENKCCWECKACGKDDVLVNNKCQTCAKGFVPDQTLSSCSKLPLKYVNMNSPLSIIFTFFSCLGILADLCVFAVFVAFREHKLIKASGREMCCFMFFGIGSIFIVPLFSLSKPMSGLCYVRRFIIGISFTICYAPLLMKMWRIHRIFKNANQLRRISATGLIGRRSLLLITVALIAMQGLFCALVFSTAPPKLVETFYLGRNEWVLECTFERFAFAIYFIYNVVLLLSCTFYAFLTRHFPKNFNEALYIGITMYLTCAVWIVFFATFLNADYSISRVYWISGSSLVIGWITLVGLFAPKLYQLYTKKEFSREMLIGWNSVRKVECPDIISRECPQCKLSYNCPRCKILDNKLNEKNCLPMPEMGISNPALPNPK